MMNITASPISVTRSMTKLNKLLLINSNFIIQLKSEYFPFNLSFTLKRTYIQYQVFDMT